MKKIKSLLAIIMVLCTLVTSNVAITAYAATAKGVISAVSNTASGIKVSWTKDTTKTGYYVYRKAGTETKFKKVKSITKNATTSWTDTSVSNGKKYVYKVCGYKGKKTSSNSTTKTIYRLTTPAISSLARTSKTSITVKSAKNASATGYQIRYSTKSDLSSYKTLTVAGNTLNATIDKLSGATKYYVRIRAYKKVGSTTYYSAFSDIKNVVTYYTAYTTNITTSLYEKATSSSKKTTVRYMSKVTLYEVTSSSSSGKYQKLKYNGKTYYVWLPSGTTKFTTTKNPYNYENVSENPYAQEVIDKAVWIFKNLDTEYNHTEQDGIDHDNNGKYGFDCSGFVSYLFNSVMQQYVPTYRVSANVETISKTNAIYNIGFDEEFSAITVCSGKLDFNKLQPGDVLFYDLPGANQEKSPNHCILYLGNNQFIHSTSSANGVEILPFMDEYLNNNYFKKAIRFVPDKVELLYKKAVIDNKEINPSTGSTYRTVKIYPQDSSSSDYYTLSRGDEVTIISTRDTYAYIEYEGGSGYIYLGSYGVDGRFDFIVE